MRKHKKIAKKTTKKTAKKAKGKKVYATKRISIKAKASKVKNRKITVKKSMPAKELMSDQVVGNVSPNPEAADHTANPAEAAGHRHVDISGSNFIPQNNSLAQHSLDAKQKFTRAARTRVNGASHRRTMNSRGK